MLYGILRNLKLCIKKETVPNYSFFIILSNSILYLTSYCKKLLNHFNRFREGELQL